MQPSSRSNSKILEKGRNFISELNTNRQSRIVRHLRNTKGLAESRAMLVLLVVLTPPFLFLFARAFLSFSPLVNCRRRCRSSLFLYLVFFFLSFSLSSVQPLKSTVPVAITSFLFFSLSRFFAERKRRKKNHYDGYPPNDVECENVY